MSASNYAQSGHNTTTRVVVGTTLREAVCSQCGAVSAPLPYHSATRAAISHASVSARRAAKQPAKK